MLLDEAQLRNFERWDTLGRQIDYNPPGWRDRDTYQKEVDWLKTWLEDRLAWMDQAIAEQRASVPPVFYIDGIEHNDDGYVQSGSTLSISSNRGGNIYYTLDGSDPRLGNDQGISPTAHEYIDPMTLTESVTVKARALSGNAWSALNKATYTVGPVAENLYVTKVMYQPQHDSDEKFVELTNIGAQTINLNLVKFTKGIDYTLSQP